MMKAKYVVYSETTDCNEFFDTFEEAEENAKIQCEEMQGAEGFQVFIAKEVMVFTIGKPPVRRRELK